MHLPRGNLPTYLRQLARISRRQEPRECLSLRLVEGLPGTKRVPAERERHRRVIPPPSIIFAVHYLRLFGVQTQPDVGEPTPDRVSHLAGLTFGHTMDHRIVREAFEPDPRILPDHPEIEAIVGSPRGISPRGSHGTERDSLPSFRSSHPLHRYARIHSQWANSSGSLSVTPRHQALNRFQVRSRLYFFRAQRIT